MTIKNPFLVQLLLAILILTMPLKAFASEVSYGYQLALLDERSKNPQKVLMKKKLNPSDATVREFEWILETLRNRCRNPQSVIITTLVDSWRIVERRGYNVTLLEFSRRMTDFSNIAFQSTRNQKLDIDKIARKFIKDKYPIKK